MAYTVTWTSEFHDDVVDAWLAGNRATRDLLTQITHLLDHRLARSPAVVGKPMASAPSVYVWIAATTPRTVEIYYEIFEVDRRVRVIRMIIR